MSDGRGRITRVEVCEKGVQQLIGGRALDPMCYTTLSSPTPGVEMMN